MRAPMCNVTFCCPHSQGNSDSKEVSGISGCFQSTPKTEAECPTSRPN